MSILKTTDWFEEIDEYKPKKGPVTVPDELEEENDTDYMPFVNTGSDFDSDSFSIWADL